MNAHPLVFTIIFASYFSVLVLIITQYCVVLASQALCRQIIEFLYKVSSCCICGLQKLLNLCLNSFTTEAEIIGPHTPESCFKDRIICEARVEHMLIFLSLHICVILHY